MPDRAIQFNQVFNFRDVGGYRAGDGRIVVRRRLFRSDDLSRLTMEDAVRFAALGIRTVIDLRRPTVRRNASLIYPTERPLTAQAGLLLAEVRRLAGSGPYGPAAARPAGGRRRAAPGRSS